MTTPEPVRQLIFFGGPLDGAVAFMSQVPFGYLEFAGTLVVWKEINIHLIPLWQGREFGQAVERWQAGKS